MLLEKMSCSFSWEIPGIQLTFNKEVKYEKAKKIADEIIENINSTGHKAELITLEKNKVYPISNKKRCTTKYCGKKQVKFH